MKPSRWTAASVVDGLAYVGPSLFGAAQREDDLLQRMDSTGIDTTVVVGARPPEYDLASANALVADLQERYGGRILGLGRVDPNRGDALAEAERCLGPLQLAGLFLHPREEVFVVNHPRVDPLLAACGDAGKPVLVATGFPWVSEALQVADLATRFPDVPVVMTNGGQLNISGLGQLDAQLALQNCPNVTLQTGGVYRQDFLEGVAERFGAERLMFAGGSPDLDPSYEILRVRAARLTPQQQETVLAGTANRLFRR